MGISILAFIVVLGVLVFFHEFGHFIVARLCGVGVEIFSLGFGPRIWGWKSGRTDYRISAIPLGGFVKMVGDELETEAEIDPEDIPISFNHKPVIQRIMIVAAGPIFNLLLTALILFSVFRIAGVEMLRPVVKSVEEGSPAAAAGIKGGDSIAAIDGKTIEGWHELSGIILTSNGRQLRFDVRRGDKMLAFEITPKRISEKNYFGKEQERFIIGVVPTMEKFFKKLTPQEAMRETIFWTFESGRQILFTLAKIIQGAVPARDALGGPIMIAKMAGEQVKEGAVRFFLFMASLSACLGVMNLLPIPVLDGGHLLFFILEMVMQRPVNIRVRETAMQAGLFILLLLTVFVFYNDISRIFFAS